MKTIYIIFIAYLFTGSGVNTTTVTFIAARMEVSGGDRCTPFRHKVQITLDDESKKEDFVEINKEDEDTETEAVEKIEKKNKVDQKPEKKGEKKGEKKKDRKEDKKEKKKEDMKEDTKEKKKEDKKKKKDNEQDSKNRYLRSKSIKLTNSTLKQQFEKSSQSSIEQLSTTQSFTTGKDNTETTESTNYITSHQSEVEKQKEKQKEINTQENERALTEQGNINYVVRTTSTSTKAPLKRVTSTGVGLTRTTSKGSTPLIRTKSNSIISNKKLKTQLKFPKKIVKLTLNLHFVNDAELDAQHRLWRKTIKSRLIKVKPSGYNLDNSDLLVLNNIPDSIYEPKWYYINSLALTGKSLTLSLFLGGPKVTFTLPDDSNEDAVKEDKRELIQDICKYFNKKT
jgi:hypothetical protein